MRTLSIALGLVSGVLLLTPQARSGGPPGFSGGIFGQVKNAPGVAQMGATVLLYDRYDQLVRRALTNEQGKFAFDQLTPDLYSIRVSLASFVPAIRRNIAVASGSENLLQISLANLFSTVDLISSGPSRGTLMTDDWKWVLRSSQATRPVLRLLPGSSTSGASSPGSIFSDTTGLVQVSAGDGESFAGGGSQQDLGTAFALATSIFGTSRLQFSGNIGYIGNSSIPAAGFRTTYSRGPDGSGPQVTLTVRQLYLPSSGMGDSQPALRTASLGLRDSVDLSENLRLEYGVNLESLSFLERVTYMSPFARATYDLARFGAVKFAYSSGTQPAAFAAEHSANPDSGALNNASLNQDLAALALLPQISRRDDRVQVQRNQNFELGYQFVEGSRKYSASAYSETVSNAALMLAAPNGFLPYGDTLPDLGANDRIFNIGSYSRVGYTAAVKQSLGRHLDATFAAGHTGALRADARFASASTGDDVRAMIHEVDRPWLAASLSATVPVTGTFVMTTYGWTDSRVLMPDHLYMTQDISQSIGLNIRLRQPLPLFSGMGGRLEATAELRNLLAQGYLPLDVANRKALLTTSPRMVRGGLAFIF
jgi:hypothetical protein